MAQFPFLPGTTVQVEDQGLKITAPPAGPVILLLGKTTSTNVNATPYAPYPVYNSSISQADQYFRNSDGSVSEVCQALYECTVAGGQNIVLCNILPTASGSMSSYGVIGGSVGVNDTYGYLAEAYTVLINYNADIIVPLGCYMDQVVSTNYGPGPSTNAGGFNFGYQLANFAYQCTIGNNTAIGVIGINNALDGLAATTHNPSGVPTLQQINTWVTNASNYTGALACYNGTTATAVGVPGNYCFVAMSTQQMPPNYASGDTTDALGNKVDIGSYISVVAANVAASNIASYILYPTLGWYNSTGAAAYAGLVASLPSKSAATNKIIQGLTLQQGISASQANSLCGSRYVTFLSKPKGLAVASAMTGAYNINQYSRSDYVRLTTVRIVHDAINYIRQIGDPFIGEPNNGPQRNALSTAINTALTNMQTNGALQRFNFTVFASPTDQVLGNANVQLQLVPSFELQTITVTVALASQ